MTIRFLRPIQGWQTGQVTSDVGTGVCIEWIRRGYAEDAGDAAPGVVTVKPLNTTQAKVKGKKSR